MELLKDNGIAISMDSRGRALDDIFIERLWRSVKQEYVYLNPCETGDELWRGLDRYFRLYICNANPQTKTTLISPISGSNFGTHYSYGGLALKTDKTLGLTVEE